MSKRGKANNNNKKGGAADRALPNHINREGRDDNDDESESGSSTYNYNNGNDANPDDLRGKYDDEVKKKGKGVRSR